MRTYAKAQNVAPFPLTHKGSQDTLPLFSYGKADAQRFPMPKSPKREERPEIPPGTLDLLILRCVTREPQHGYAIARMIKEQSSSTLLVEEGSLYPALHRLVRLKHVTAEWGASENNRKARFYRITTAGRKRLAADVDMWKRVSSAVTAVLDQHGLGPAEGRTACSA
jgi:PadR family transcriptional regulator, regulatory protein PadR